MSSGANLEVELAARGDVPRARSVDEKALKQLTQLDSDQDEVLVGPNGEQYPSKEDLATLRRTYGSVNWVIYTIGLLELVERFAYYGTTIVFTNFLSYPLPEGSTTGAGGTDKQAGALGRGQQTSTALTLFNQFWAYLMPLVADQYWGRWRTISYGIAVATVGHILILVSALPSVIKSGGGALGAFIPGIICFGVGVGWFKTNISPLVAEQYERQHPRAYVETLKSGERVIVDPMITITRVYVRYYWMVNVGALVGQISMVYAEKYVGFWLSYTLPTILFLLCPIVMIVCRKRYVRRPPTGSVLGKAVKLMVLAIKRNRAKDSPKLGFWENVKPSNMQQKPAWMTFDDAWVEEVQRGFNACAVFMFLPIYWLSYSQMTNNLTNQAATMKLGGVPNDIVNNLNPLTLLLMIPVFDKVIYPALARAGIKFTPIKKMTMGFFVGFLSMLVCTLIQHYIYERSPCGYNASDIDCITENGPPDMSVWIQTPAYVLIGIAEIFASITGLEYAFTKAPKNMRSFVTAIFWFSNAFSSAIGQAFVPLAKDPHITWLYGSIAIISAVGGPIFWFTFRSLDKREEALNVLPESTYRGRKNSLVDPEFARAQRDKENRIRKAQGLV